MPSPRRSTQLSSPAPARFAPALLVLGLGGALAAGAGGCKKTEPPPSGNIAAALTAPTLEGTPFDPAALAGKPALVLFVSPTCPHCLEELPAASKVAKAAGAPAVAVFIAGKAENARGAVERTKFEGAVLVDDGTLRTRYGIRAVPYTLVLGPDGKARELLRGAHGAERLAEALADAR